MMNTGEDNLRLFIKCVRELIIPGMYATWLYVDTHVDLTTHTDLFYPHTHHPPSCNIDS